MTAQADVKVEDLLRKVYLFQEVDGRTLRNIAKQGKFVDHPAGTDIVDEGGAAFGFHLIIDGEVEVVVHDERRRLLRAGDYFGEIALIDGQRRSATVRTTAPTTTWALSGWNFRSELKKQPELAHALLLGLCSRLREAEQLPTQQ